jgi:hypothetical protein
MKSKLRWAVDGGLTVCLLLLMGYELIGQTAHEGLGILMLALFIVHHILNRKWTANLLRGRYSPYRVFQTALAALILVSIILQGVSGIALSRQLFVGLSLPVPKSLARTWHMAFGYWGFVLMGLHIGLHWSMVLGGARKRFGSLSGWKTWLPRLLALAVCAYGLYAFVKRGFPGYLTMQTHFAFFDYDEPLALFYLDYLAIMGLFTAAGYYLSKLLKSLK